MEIQRNCCGEREERKTPCVPSDRRTILVCARRSRKACLTPLSVSSEVLSEASEEAELVGFGDVKLENYHHRIKGVIGLYPFDTVVVLLAEVAVGG